MPIYPNDHCSGLLGRTPLRPMKEAKSFGGVIELFRSSRPDSIETVYRRYRVGILCFIVPVF